MTCPLCGGVHEPLVLVPFGVAGLERSFEERRAKRTHFATCSYAPGMRLAVTMPPCYDLLIAAGNTVVSEEPLSPVNELEA